MLLIQSLLACFTVIFLDDEICLSSATKSFYFLQATFLDFLKQDDLIFCVQYILKYDWMQDKNEEIF